MLRDVYKTAPSGKELYVPQQNMLSALSKAREEGISECYVDVATGVGKTYAIAHDIKDYMQENPGARVLYLCHKGQVLEQARETIAHVVDYDVTHGNFYKNQYEDQEQVVYATFQQMMGGSGGGKNYQAFDPEEFDYVVVDEGHHGPAPTYTEVIEYFHPDFQAGLTATDERMDGKDISEVLGPKVFEYTLEEAIAEGVLVKPDYRLFTEHEADLKDLLDDEDMPPTLKDINDRLTKVQRDRNYQKAIVCEIQAAQAEHTDPRTVIYCPDIEYAEDFSEFIPEGQTLHSGLLDEEQDERLKAFRRGEIPTLLVVDIFNEGIDVPEINTMVFLRGTESKMIFLQQLGRGLRTAEGKDKVIALDFAASWQRIMLIAELKDKVYTIYRDRASSFIKEKTGKRSKREYFDTNDMVPFEFNFSKDALDAVNIVEKIRKEKSKPKRNINHGSRLEAWKNADKTLEKMLGLGPYNPDDPDNPRNLPNQRMTKEEEQKYAAKIALGDKNAQQEYIMRRLRYMLSKAQYEFARQSESSMLTVDDHFQNGLEALVVGLDTYGAIAYHKQPDIRKYINMHIWGGIQRPSVEATNAVRIPSTDRQRMKVIDKIVENHVANSEDGKEPTYDEIINGEDAPVYSKDDLRILEVAREILEKGLLDESTIPEDLIGEGTADVIYEVSRNMTREQIYKALNSLDAQQKRVIVLRLALEGGEKRTLDEVSFELGLTRERVRQIEHSALKAIKRSYHGAGLRGAYSVVPESDHLTQTRPPSLYAIDKAKQRLSYHEPQSVEWYALKSYLQKWDVKESETPHENITQHVEVNGKLGQFVWAQAKFGAQRAMEIEEMWLRHKRAFDLEQKKLKEQHRKRREVVEAQMQSLREEQEREKERQRAEKKREQEKRKIEKQIKTARRHIDWLNEITSEQDLSESIKIYENLITELNRELQVLEENSIIEL